MDRKRWTSFQSQWIVGALVFLWFTAPSFAQSPTEGFSVQKIEVTATPAGSRLAIEGSRSFEYTVFRLNDPLRVVIDLPQAQLGKLAGPLEVKDGTINVIRSRQLDDAQRRAARVEIGLDQMVEYDVNSEGNVLYVNFGKPAVSAAKAPEKTEAAKKAPPSAAVPGKKAKALKGLEISSSEGGVSVGIKGDGEIPDYKSFQLSRPARLVVDLPQMRNASGKRNIDVGSRLLKDIRIGQHQDKLRLVFNFPEAKAPRYQLNREGQDVILTLGDAKAPAEKAQAPEPAKPVQTAQAPAPPAAAPPSKEEAAAPSKETIVIKEETPPAEAKPAESEKTPVGPYRGSRISLDFKDADIHNIFRLIAEVSSLNIITTEDVKGKVTIRLVNVPWDQALDVILAAKNLIKIEEGNVLRITTVDTLRKDREDKQKEEENLVKTRDTKLKLEDPATKVIRLSYADCNDIQRLLLGAMPTGVALPPGMTAGTMKRLLTPQGMVNADKRTNTLIIQDIRGNLEEIEQLVRQLDYPTPQVAIEARVVQAVTTFTRSLGIQWGGSYNQTGSNWYYGLTGHN
ncbi:MAG TPA: AMIN domain-containing protein, partial [Thermodesulfobacteriota bacterium]|nr:AMIN domain-containing protein [Thermodesulfobacteriota bacterium]